MGRLLLLVVFAAFVLGVAGLWVVAIFKWDRKRSTLTEQLGEYSPEELRRTALVVVLPASVAEVSRLAETALREMRARGIEQHGGGLITGWVGHTLTNIPGRVEYQLIVRAVGLPNSGTEVFCAATPRFKSALFTNTRAAELRQQLAQALTSGMAHLHDR